MTKLGVPFDPVGCDMEMNHCSPTRPDQETAVKLASPPSAKPSLAEPLLTCQEAAQLLSVKPAWIYAAARSGRLTCVRVGRNVRLLRSDLEHFVARQRTNATANGGK